MKEDFNFNGFDVYYCPHPELYGKWEIFKGEEFTGRAKNKKEAKEKILELKNICKEKI